MHVLLSNDDGYFAPGLAALAELVKPLASKLTVVAPERDRSGVSNSLTLDRPLMVRQALNGFHFVNGTPTDCVHVALTGFLKDKPDLVISGINRGANMGDDTVYSGTVAAATEGFLFGIPSLAISLAGKEVINYEAASTWLAGYLPALIEKMRSASQTVLLNLNIPDTPASDIKGIKVVRLGHRHAAEPVIQTRNPRGEEVYWVGLAGEAADAGDDTDFGAVAAGYASLTPLQLDLTHYNRLNEVSAWGI
jgi:5'-nucleotidase